MCMIQSCAHHCYSKTWIIFESCIQGYSVSNHVFACCLQMLQYIMNMIKTKHNSYMNDFYTVPFYYLTYFPQFFWTSAPKQTEWCCIKTSLPILKSILQNLIQPWNISMFSVFTVSFLNKGQGLYSQIIALSLGRCAQIQDSRIYCHYAYT